MNLLIGILRYSILAPCHWLLTAVSYILVPLLVLFQKDGWLPAWCWYFQTWDNPLDGDTGWQQEHRPYLDVPYQELTCWQLYVSRVLWLYRNPVYGFERAWLSASVGTLAQYGMYPHVLYVSDKGYFFWNGEVNVTSTKKLNWLLGWKLAYPDRPIPICSTMRFQTVRGY